MANTIELTDEQYAKLVAVAEEFYPEDDPDYGDVVETLTEVVLEPGFETEL